jgi:predicted proteasome-type protease
MLTSIRETWDLGLKNAFLKLPRFDWEQVIDKDSMS